MLALGLLVVLATVVGSAELLDPGRTPSWDVGDINRGPDLGQPEQVHLAFGGDPSTLTVTWLVFSDIPDSFVEWGLTGGEFQWKAAANTTLFTYRTVKRYVYRALIDGIEPGVLYSYRVGSDHGLSNVFTFKGLKERPDGGYRYAVFGDLGVENGRSVGQLTKEVQAGEYDMILHTGDFAYDLGTGDGSLADSFFRIIEPMAATVPYMVIPGNHEWLHDIFYNYVQRFTMPKSYKNIFDLGLAHIIGFSTEVYLGEFLKPSDIADQYKWLEEDLKKANENRNNVPWIITLGHRAMYCSTNDLDECNFAINPVRVGIAGLYPLEKLLYKYGVDVELWAHEHVFQRLWPIYDRVVYNGTDEPYTDPPAPVHILSGSAGCKENTDSYVHRGPWEAFFSSNYGFGRMQIFNSTHLSFEQGTVEDKVWIIRNKHEPFTDKHVELLKRYGTVIPQP